jgi:hypothetical protein
MSDDERFRSRYANYSQSILHAVQGPQVFQKSHSGRDCPSKQIAELSP